MRPEYDGELILKKDNKFLKFTVINKFWYEIYLCENYMEIKLGANSPDRIFCGLITSFLPVEERKYFTFSNMKLFTVMNLMDSHSTIAGYYKNNMLELFFIDTSGNIIPMMSLSPEIETEWIKEIISFIIYNKEHTNES